MKAATMLLLIAFTGTCAISAEPKAKSDRLSAAWLERGCLALRAYEKGGATLTREQDQEIMNMISWLNGFLVGANGMMFAGNGKDSDESLAITQAVPDWFDARLLGPELLGYIQQNRKLIDPDMHARVVMLSFYLSCHPRANDYQKFVGKDLLTNKDNRIPRAVPVKKKR